MNKAMRFAFIIGLAIFGGIAAYPFIQHVRLDAFTAPREQRCPSCYRATIGPSHRCYVCDPRD